MLKKYKFIKEPRYNHDTREVVIGFEDHFQMMGMLEQWLNLPTTSPSATVTQQTYLNMPIQYINREADQPYINQQQMNTVYPGPVQHPVFAGYTSPLQQQDLYYDRMTAHQQVIDLDRISRQQPVFGAHRSHQQTSSTFNQHTKQTVASNNITSLLAQLASVSKILSSPAGQKLGKSPLDFLSKELSKFTSAREIFTTWTAEPKRVFASDFHKACDNVENIVVIIKSGQYIAGGYTEVPFESPENGFFKPNPKGTTFVFSANKRKVYSLKNKDSAIYCDHRYGPYFGDYGLSIWDDLFDGFGGHDHICAGFSSFYDSTAVPGELFGTEMFKVDQFEVYKLE